MQDQENDDWFNSWVTSGLKNLEPVLSGSQGREMPALLPLCCMRNTLFSDTEWAVCMRVARPTLDSRCSVAASRRTVALQPECCGSEAASEQSPVSQKQEGCVGKQHTFGLHSAVLCHRSANLSRKSQIVNISGLHAILSPSHTQLCCLVGKQPERTCT